MASETITLVARLTEVFTQILVYGLLGFGPGLIVGILTANRLFAKNNPRREQKHMEAIEKATEHNKQWDPNNPKWQK